MPEWLWTETAAAWASTGVAAVAVYFALKTWRASLVAIRGSYRPLLRPVALQATLQEAQEHLVVKNYGIGPAIAVVVLRQADLLRIAEVDVIEPLGTMHGPHGEGRIGREVIKVDPPLESGTQCRLLYQDLGGRWHETAFYFVIRKHTGEPTPTIMEIEYLGPRRSGFWRRQIPRGVANYLAHVKAGEVE